MSCEGQLLFIREANFSDSKGFIGMQLNCFSAVVNPTRADTFHSLDRGCLISCCFFELFARGETPDSTKSPDTSRFQAR